MSCVEVPLVPLYHSMACRPQTILPTILNLPEAWQEETLSGFGGEQELSRLYLFSSFVYLAFLLETQDGSQNRKVSSNKTVQTSQEAVQ